MKLTYTIIILPDSEGGYVVEVPALPGCVTYGHTLSEALLMVEDAIFANYFHIEGNMDKRAYDTYSQVTQHFLETLPIPDLLIYCACSPSICRQRLANRQSRSFEKFYPPDHVEKLWQIYEDWINKFNSCPAVSIDTEKYDIRNPKITHKILNEIQTTLKEGNDRQLDLFENSERFNNGINTTIINRINDVPFQSKNNFEFTPLSKKTKIHRSVYVAAPFTKNYKECPVFTRG